MSGNPNLPPLAQMLDRALSPAEAAEFAAHLRWWSKVAASTGRP
jgi:hypothetical protein